MKNILYRKNFGKCDICKDYLISDNRFNCKISSKKYYINNDFDYNSMNFLYRIGCTNCNEQYVYSALDFENTQKKYQNQQGQMLGCSSFH